MKKTSAPVLPDTPQRPRRFGSDADLEKITGRKRRTWQKDRLFNRGPRWYKVGGRVLYDIDEVLAYIDAHAAGGEIVSIDGRQGGKSLGSNLSEKHR